MKLTKKQAKKKYPNVKFIGDYFYINEGAVIREGAIIGKYRKNVKEIEPQVKKLMKNHIHTWNDYKDGKLCCSTCGIFYNDYLKEENKVGENENKKTIGGETKW